MQMPALSPALAFEGVSKRYGETIAVDDVSVAIAGGSFVALVGTSGSGKSTLLKTVNRLVEPTAGRVTIDGVDVATGPAPALRRRVERRARAPRERRAEGESSGRPGVEEQV